MHSMTLSSRAPVSLIPPTRLLVSGLQEGHHSLFALRPGGTSEWVLIYTQEGQAYFRYPGGQFMAGADDVILMRPHYPQDYGIDECHGYWRDIWTHFIPRAEVLEWLRWPELAPGLMHLRLSSPLKEQVLSELVVMDEANHSVHRHSEHLAVNALERALLLCDSVNPRHAEGRRDPRIRKAVELLCRRFAESFTLEELALRCGMSRSRFAELFRQELGTTPIVFLEMQRLRRARELLAHTSLTIAQVAGQVGFPNPFYFSLRFKKQFGANPRAFRQSTIRETTD